MMLLMSIVGRNLRGLGAAAGSLISICCDVCWENAVDPLGAVCPEVVAVPEATSAALGALHCREAGGGGRPSSAFGAFRTIFKGLVRGLEIRSVVGMGF